MKVQNFIILTFYYYFELCGFQTSFETLYTQRYLFFP